MRKSIFVAAAILLIASVGCEKEDSSLVVDFNHSYRTISDTAFEALVVPLVLHSAQVGASGIYVGTDSLNLIATGTKIESSVAGAGSYSIVVDSLIPAQTYYWLPYLEANWVEFRGEMLSF